jgi:hypothetical protein
MPHILVFSEGRTLGADTSITFYFVLARGAEG